MRLPTTPWGQAMMYLLVIAVAFAAAYILGDLAYHGSVHIW